MFRMPMRMMFARSFSFSDQLKHSAMKEGAAYAYGALAQLYTASDFHRLSQNATPLLRAALDQFAQHMMDNHLKAYANHIVPCHPGAR